MSKLNIVMTVKDRFRLTYQALESLQKNTVNGWHLTIVDDGSHRETRNLLRSFQEMNPDQVTVIHVNSDAPEAGVLGALKNLGATLGSWASEWLYQSDNDVYFLPGWDRVLIHEATVHRADGFLLVGGQNHPYHKPIDRIGGLNEYYAVAGTSWLMRWITWETFGPLNADAKGTGQSEDTAFCNRIRDAGYKVGAVDPPVVIDTGISQTDGSKSIGWDAKVKNVPGVLYL